MRRDKDDTHGRIPPEQTREVIFTKLEMLAAETKAIRYSGKTLEQNWQLTEAMVYDAMWKLKIIHNNLLPIHDCHQRIQTSLGDITPIETTAIHLYGHWIVYGWDVAKPMVREIYPGIVNNHISSAISGIGKL